jgi:hypothetical protein
MTGRITINRWRDLVEQNQAKHRDDFERGFEDIVVSTTKDLKAGRRVDRLMYYHFTLGPPKNEGELT